VLIIGARQSIAHVHRACQMDRRFGRRPNKFEFSRGCVYPAGDKERIQE
jgi:hypothetical protein